FSAVGIIGSLCAVAGFATGCGSDDTSDTPGATGGSGGEDSGSTGGSLGTGGATGDAAPDVDYKPLCMAGESASESASCGTTCACENCPDKAFNCFYAGTDVSAACTALITCAAQNNCTSTNCPPCAAVIAANLKGV